ncbi:Radical SAM superfamily protein [Poriferisphaera corsica]|uniref:Radical SAM superfamily protein n=1 Tax=Poriferisphaera corsica TaxID=2528020 RepID=A0A517YXQ2_9BACT|nr:arsenosugar biosynthesis radical SAM (seleno)protein ArsS [Poriferisphaera corsica]QDU34979.1 Radical SAM superfamily protein [Poriferisphaera corsica]
MTHSIHLPLHEQPDQFASRLAADGQQLVRDQLTTLQLNLGKMCNLACHHCHVEAGPGRTEIMSRQTMDHILTWLDLYNDQLQISVADLTGGAPEMNPHFSYLVTELKNRGLHILDRCNLSILLQPGYEHLPAFLVDNHVEIVASMPCYLQENVDKQRGLGVFDESIQALHLLNALGYGMPQSSLRLDLVYNPVGYGLPPAQPGLEAAYKDQLAKNYNIHFNSLFTITNMPIKRFEHSLIRDGQYEAYMEKLKGAHNKDNVAAVMCRSLVSIGYEGAVYDCDFNQMIQMPLDGPPPVVPPQNAAKTEKLDAEHFTERNSKKIWQFTPDELLGRHIRTASHCFGCTAGAGSSCTGALN